MARKSPRKIGSLRWHRPLAWSLAACILLGVVLVFSSGARAAWYNANWQHRKKLTIDYTKVGATLTNFPVLVSLSSDSDLAADAQDDGDDILFTSSDGTTKLDHEIESFNGTTGQLVAWVKIPSLSNAADTEIYMYYGYASATTQQNKTGVWNDGGSNYYKGVWHLSEEQAGTGNTDLYQDSTGNGNHGDDYVSATGQSGKIDGGQDFDGVNDYITVPRHSSLEPATAITFEAWLNWDNHNNSAYGALIHKARDVDEAPYVSYSLEQNDTAQTIQALVNVSGTLRTATAVNVSEDTWHHLVVTWSSGDYIRLYLDGSQASTSPGTYSGSITYYNTPLGLGENVTTTGNTAIDGLIDEVRISGTARTASWISTEYNNQNNPGPASGAFFKSLGSEETQTQTNYNYRKQITIDYTKVGAGCSGSLTDFPVLIKIASDDDLRTTTNGGHVENSNGYDIIFRASDGTTQLDHEVEKYTASTGELLAWVRVPSLSHTANTIIYLYYGNSNISSSQENITGVWDTNYKAVWHFSGSSYLLDSTTNNNDGTNHSTSNITGQIADARRYLSSSSQYIDMGSGSSINITGKALTVEAWIRATAFGTNIYDNSIASNEEWPSGNTNGYVLRCGEDGDLSLNVGTPGQIWYEARTTNNPMATDTWYHVVGRYNGSNVEVFINGTSRDTTPCTANINSSATNLNIGRSAYAAGRFFNGNIDEVRISNTVRTLCWIQTEYNNQQYPNKAQYPSDGFITVGSEELVSTLANLTEIHYRWRNDDGGEGGGSSWYNESWSRRKAITIDNTGNSNTLTNYQVQVTAAYDSDMQADFDDIRFTNASGTELDYWLYSKTDGVSATFWVEVDSIAASSNTTIYMYYGNASVTTTSSAKNTMFIYENMDSAPTGTLKGTAYYDATNDWVRLTTTAAGPGQLEYGSSPTPGFVAEWRFWTGGGSGADAVWLYARTSSTPAYEDDPTNGYSFVADEWDNQLQVYYNNNTNKLSYWGTTTIDNSTWHDVRIVFYQSGTTYYYQYWYDGTQRISSSSTNAPSGSLFGWGARIGGYTNEHRIDDLVVRKYTSPEPTVSTASEEPVGATWATAEDTKLTGAMPGTIYRLRFEVANAGGTSSGAVTYRLQVAETGTCGSGSYADVPTDTSGAWQIVDSTYLTDGSATTNVTPGLTDAETTFVPGQVKDTGNTTGSITLAADQFAEIEFSVKATTNATYGGDYCFRLYKQSAGTTLDTYSVYGEIQLSPCQYNYYKTITIDYTKVGGSCASSLTDFPVLVSISGDANLKTVANGGNVQNSSGYDLVFRAANGLDQLYHEVEKYDGAAGTLVAWVKIPTLSNTANTVIRLYYGNPCVSVATESPTNVWDSNYVMVQHFEETDIDGGSGDIKDSKSPQYNGTTSGMDSSDQVAGEIDGSFDFDGGNDYVTVATLPNSAQATVECWFKYDTSGDNEGLVSKGTFNAGDVHFKLHNTAPTPHLVAVASGQTGVESGQITSGTWYHAVYTYTQGGNILLYVNGNQVDSGSAGSNAWSGANIQIGHEYTNYGYGTRYFDGQIDEVRISNTVRTPCWIQTTYNNQKYPNKAQYPSDGFITVGSQTSAGVTAVDLLSFTATGDGSAVKVAWETAQELENAGFNLYRGATREGPFARLNEKLIAGRSFLLVGDTYTYRDTRIIPWELYYYKLEDVDTHGRVTSHGPISVDWDGDGIPDDWEIAHGLNPRVKDGGGDPDGDGVTNLLEYMRGTDPLNPDTDGDGILDGWDLTRERVATAPSSMLGPGVRVVASDETGMTLELETEHFLAEKLEVGGAAYDRIRVPSYIHGLTQEVGKPELPVKGILLDLPEGASASLRVGQCDTRSYQGVLVYPVPEGVGEERGGMARVSEIFTIDQAAYGTDAFYPGTVAALGETFTCRDTRKLQVLFYPLSFNPVTRELLQYTKIRVRVAYEAGRSRSALRGLLAAAAGMGEGLESLGESSAPTGRSLSAWTPPAGGSAYRVLVSEEGIYRLSSAWFTAQGIDRIDLSQVRLYNEGQEVAIRVSDENDFIEFCGRAPSSQYSKYAKYNVYWLTTSGGTGSPARMAEVDGTPGVGTVPGTYTATVHHEEDRWYWLGAPGADSLDRWFLTYIYGPGIYDELHAQDGGLPVPLTLTLPGVSGEGSLRVRLCGVYDTDHVVEVALNGTPLGTLTWSGIAFHEETFESVAFLPGTNTVRLRVTSGTDSIAVDWLEATYPRDFAAGGDSLTFTHEGASRFEVSGLGGSEVSVFEVTSPIETKRVTGFQISGSGPYTVEFEPAETGDRTYLVLASSALKTPARITRDTPSTLASSSNGADYILITHRGLGWDGGGSPQPWLTSLVSLRESQGLRVKVVDIQDVFDEFSYGIEAPQAVKDFLAYAYASWQRPAPRYVLLVGDATYDPKGNWSWLRGDPTATYLPTYLVSTPHMGETVTDEWFARVSGDDLVPDLYLGRLPAATAAQAEVMVGKIVSYETAPNTKSWEKSVLLIADDAEEEYETVFEQMNEDAAALLPASMGSPFKGYLADYLAAADLTSEIKTRITAGALLVNYSGHGSTQILATEQVFTTGHVSDLANGERLPFFVTMTCLAGYFGYPESWGFPSLAESLLRAEGKGAVAAFMPTGMTLPEGQNVLDRALLDALFTQDIRTLGPAVSQAKQTLLANGAELGEVSETFLLFGDPAMGLKVPLPRRVSGVTAEGTKNGVSLRWETALDCNGSAVSGYNVYRATSPGGSYVKVKGSPIAGLSFADTGLVDGGTYYYVVRAVDGDGLEGARSAALGETAGSDTVHAGTSGGGGGGGGCFVATAADRLLDEERAARLAAVILGASLFVLLVAFSVRNNRARRSGDRSSLPEDGVGSEDR